MKKVLSLLVAFVVLQTQSWALSGGPNYGGAGISLIGVYAGVLIPGKQPTTPLTGTTSVTDSSANIGLFSLGVPETGLATGACVVFVNGDAFSGTITGVADPGKGSVVAVVDTISNFIVFDPANPTIPFRLFATGQLKAIVREIPGGRSAIGLPAPGAIRLEGSATLTVTGGDTVTYTVDGFQQSNMTATTTISGLGNIGGGGGAGGNGP